VKGAEFWIIGVGLAFGWLVPKIWEKVSPAKTAKAFWGSLAKLSHSLVTDLDSEDFMQNYGRLLKMIGAYAGRNLLALAATIGPVVLFWGIFLTPGAPATRDEAAAYLELQPPQEARLTAGQQSYAFSKAEYRIPIDFVTGRSGRLESALGSFEIETLYRSHALCASTWQCLLFQSLNFKTNRYRPAPGTKPASAVLRPSDGDRNYFWPFLSDKEFSFLLALSAASLVGFYRRSRTS
jgi:hypothetical protein